MNKLQAVLSNKKIRLKCALTALLSMLIVALIANPTRYIQSVYGGILLFVSSVLPALFPFFFFSKALTAIGTASLLAHAFARPVRLLYNAPPTSSYIMIMSMLSGYPIGACLIANYYEQGLITTHEASKIATFTSTSGPLFIIGTVAGGFLGNPIYGYIILAAHYIGSMLNGILYRGKSTVATSHKWRKGNHATPPNNYVAATNSAGTNTAKSTVTSSLVPSNIDITLSDIATSSISNIMIVGAYIAIFSMVIDFLIDIKVVGSLASMLNMLGCPLDIATGSIISLVEVTRGLLILSKSGLSIVYLLPLITALISFGGMSITMQSVTFLSKCKITAGRYLLTKLTQAVISYFVCYLFCLML